MLFEIEEMKNNSSEENDEHLWKIMSRLEDIKREYEDILNDNRYQSANGVFQKKLAEIKVYILFILFIYYFYICYFKKKIFLMLELLLLIRLLYYLFFQHLINNNPSLKKNKKLKYSFNYNFLILYIKNLLF